MRFYFGMLQIKGVSLMQIPLIIVSSVVCLSVMPFFLTEQRNKSYRSLILKMVCASMFVLVGAFAVNKAGFGEYAKFMFFGLVCSWFGDLFLHIPGKGAKISAVFGVIFFLCAHIMYLSAYYGKLKEISPDTRFITSKEILIIFGLMLIYIGVLVLTKTGFSPLLVPLAIYIFFLFLMCIKSVALAYIISSGSLAGAIILSIGGIFFVLSDTSLGLLMFNKKLKTNFKLKIFNIATYFIGQLLLASTILFIA